MIFLVAYAAAFWLTIFTLRRRWQGWVVLFVGPIPLFLLTAGASLANSGLDLGIDAWVRSLGMFGGILHLVSGALSVVMLMGGLLIVVQPRRPLSHECPSCRYDLSGATGSSCPECGMTFATAPSPAKVDGGR